MSKKRFLMVILLIILIVGIIIIALNFDRFGKPEVLSKPVFDNPEIAICELSSIPSITLKSNNGDCEIYYTLDGDNPNAEFLKYDKPILLEEPNQDERIIEFTLKAFARKDGCKDSPFLVQRVSFDFPTNDSGGDAISCGEPKIGDTVVEGSSVVATGRVVEVPVGDEMLGRVVDALGRPIDDKGEITTSTKLPIEREAPGVIDRHSVDEPLETGIKIIDSMIPIGKGQRELIIGDRQTGKTAIAIDTILNQKGKNVKCIYVAIGQKNSTVAQIVEKLKQNDALEYTTIVVSGAGEPAALQYIAPYAGCAIGEYWRDKGEDVLIVYDDLSKHAIAYRTLSLLLRRPPGREAYPGDVFYLHSRLLERSAKLSKEKGSGSLTALPIVETLAGDISAYIPTNVISITDGQIFLQTDLFNSGVRPAVDSGFSVSRVGSSAQYKAMKQVSKALKLELAQYHEVLDFAQFGSDLDNATKETINHGQHLTELLKQKQYSPMSLSEMTIMLFANQKGFVDQIALNRVSEYEKGLLSNIKSFHGDVIEQIETNKSLSESLLSRLEEIIKEYTAQFVLE